MFLASVIAAGGTFVLQRSSYAQILTPSTKASSSAGQSKAICSAATRLLQTLAPEKRERATFPFPKGQSPTAIGFGPMRGRPGGNGQPHHDVSFDAEGHLNTNSESNGGFGPGGGPPGGPGGGFGPHGPGPGKMPAAGEKYGQAVWTNFPVNDVPRPGVQMGQLTDVERKAVHDLLQIVLSPMGYQKVLNIMAADQIVADAGPDYSAGLNVYTFALFGQPSTTSPWMLQFGGHHLGLNVTFVGDKAICSPLHTGILPARFEANGKLIRGLGPENDKAFELLGSFTPDQVKTVTIDHAISDLVFGPGHPDAKLVPQGLLGVDMTEHQRQMMLGLIGEWVGVLNDAHTASRLEEIRHSLAETRFAWSGPTTHEPEHNGEAYFRIHGPSLIIEHAPQGNQGGYKIHVHTVMRDLGNDYARQLV